MRRLYLNVSVGLILLIAAAHGGAQRGQLAWAIHYDPKTFDPAMVGDEASETVRVLTGGTLLRVDRLTLNAVPQLAQSWDVSKDGRTVRFRLRPGLAFSNGAPLTSADVVATLRHILDAKASSPKASLFPTGTTVAAPDRETVVVHAPSRIDSPDWAFDEISIEPGGRGEDERVTAGPFFVARYAQGQFVELARNAHFWRGGYPRVSSIHLDILANREQEMMRLIRGQYQFVDPVPAADVAGISRRAPGLIHDLGPSLEFEEMWFNQSPRSPMPGYKRAWFQNRVFRVAVSEAIHRADLARIAFDGHATPADGFYAPSGGAWRNKNLRAPAYDPGAALRQLQQAGWKLQNGTLMDPQGHAVEFSLVTNAGNEPRARMLALIQQDLAKIGMHVTLVKLDFPSLIERLTSSFDYDACLLGTTNLTPTPEATRDVWRSSSPTHTWNPSEKTPATPWEAELDRQWSVLNGSTEFAVRKRAFDRVQQIVADEQPIIPLVYRNRVSAVSPRVTGLKLSVLAPPWWNIEELGVTP
ncbi:MAG: ABC transporter substrate-binding protein [Acidobacteriota bacterium]